MTRRLLFLIIGALGVLLVGCSDDDSSDDTVDTGGEPTEESTTEGDDPDPDSDSGDGEDESDDGAGSNPDGVDGGGSDPESTTTTAPPPTAAPTTAVALAPGQECAPGSHPDCIDPDEDGTSHYLLGGADCMASPIGGSLCSDLDGDGYAGYPDSEAVATTVAPTTAPPTTAGLSPGQVCTSGSHYDCIDPDGDGTFHYLLGGGDCMASPIGGSLCSDLDGDGYAGYPDGG